MMNRAYGAYSNGFNGCEVFGFPLPMLLIIGLAVFGIYLLRRNNKQHTKKDPIFMSDKSPTVDAAEIVRLRYARGEISFEEFQTLLKHIQS